jgi:Fic family protein
MEISEKLLIIQKVSNKTQEELASKLDVSFVTINSWINNRSKPRRKACNAIDSLYKEVTGERVIPKSQLDAKKKMIIAKCKTYNESFIEIVLNNPDIYKKYMLSLTYNTNSIEGSTLTEPETASILFDNVSIPNKTIIEQMEAKNHQAALNYVLNNHRNLKINEIFILKCHSILMNGLITNAGEYRQHGVRIVGSGVPTANYLKIPGLIYDLTENIKSKNMDIVSHISYVHSKFEQIHPFSDGNGRIGRLIMQAMAIKANIPLIVIENSKKQIYYTCLQKTQLQDDCSLLENFIADSIIKCFEVIDRSNKY